MGAWRPPADLFQESFMNAVPAVVAAELNAPFPIAEEQRRRFREQGYLKIPGVLSAETLAFIDGTISRLVEAHNPLAGVPMESRDTYGKAFTQVFNLWLKSDDAKAVSTSRRLAGIATSLLGTAGVRMWHDQASSRSPAAASRHGTPISSTGRWPRACVSRPGSHSTPCRSSVGRCHSPPAPTSSGSVATSPSRTNRSN
jgi:hypothetical protein